MKTKKITVSYLRSNLKAVLKSVETGQKILIESHGREIAEIKPIENKQMAARLKLLEIGKITQMGDLVSPTGEKWNVSL